MWRMWRRERVGGGAPYLYYFISSYMVIKINVLGALQEF